MRIFIAILIATPQVALSQWAGMPPMTAPTPAVNPNGNGYWGANQPCGYERWVPDEIKDLDDELKDLREELRDRKKELNEANSELRRVSRTHGVETTMLRHRVKGTRDPFVEETTTNLRTIGQRFRELQRTVGSNAADLEKFLRHEDSVSCPTGLQNPHLFCNSQRQMLPLDQVARNVCSVGPPPAQLPELRGTPECPESCDSQGQPVCRAGAQASANTIDLTPSLSPIGEPGQMRMPASTWDPNGCPGTVQCAANPCYRPFESNNNNPRFCVSGRTRGQVTNGSSCTDQVINGYWGTENFFNAKCKAEELDSDVAELELQIKQLEQDRRLAERDISRQIRNGELDVTEAGCTDCLFDQGRLYTRSTPSIAQTLLGLAPIAAGMYGAYLNYQHANDLADQARRIGFVNAPAPSFLSYGAPFALAGVAGAISSAVGGGGFGCTPGNGTGSVLGPSGMAGPFGFQTSPYGAFMNGQAGAFGVPNGMVGSMGNTAFMPGMQPFAWNMPGLGANGNFMATVPGGFGAVGVGGGIPGVPGMGWAGAPGFGAVGGVGGIPGAGFGGVAGVPGMGWGAPGFGAGMGGMAGMPGWGAPGFGQAGMSWEFQQQMMQQQMAQQRAYFEMQQRMMEQEAARQRSRQALFRELAGLQQRIQMLDMGGFNQPYTPSWGASVSGSFSGGWNTGGQVIANPPSFNNFQPSPVNNPGGGVSLPPRSGR